MFYIYHLFFYFSSKYNNCLFYLFIFYIALSIFLPPFLFFFLNIFLFLFFVVSIFNDNIPRAVAFIINSFINIYVNRRNFFFYLIITYVIKIWKIIFNRLNEIKQKKYIYIDKRCKFLIFDFDCVSVPLSILSFLNIKAAVTAKKKIFFFIRHIRLFFFV